jgi:biopolymer transport protein TolQ
MLNLTAAFMFLLQADGDPGTAAAPLVSSSALSDLLHNIGPIAIGVLLLLLVASLYSWTVILGKASSLRKATNQSRRFIRAFRKATRLQDIAAMTSEYPASPMAQVFEDVYVTAMEQRLTWLATIAATSPFVGLFGTVMGVVDAFHGLGTAGAATLRAVAPGISEALITTAAGLFVAVPAVVAYNQLAARIRMFSAAIDDFCRELLNSLEEIPPRAPQPTVPQPRDPREPGGLPPREFERGVYK